MKNLIIMAAGASSRMKKSLDQVNLSSDVRQVAISQHKSLIPLIKQEKVYFSIYVLMLKKLGMNLFIYLLQLTINLFMIGLKNIIPHPN